MEITTVLSVGSAVTSAAALLLGFMNFRAQRTDKRANLKIIPEDATWSVVEASKRAIHGVITKRVTFVTDLHVTVSNVSERHNAIRKIEFFCDKALVELDDGTHYIEGYRTIDLVPDNPQQLEVFWEPGQPSWHEVAPCEIAPGKHQTAHACYELEACDPAEPPVVNVVVHDSFGKKYSQVIYLRYRKIDDDLVVPVSRAAGK